MSDMSSTIRVAGREGLLSAIPVLLGFHPADSVVIACLGKNNRVARSSVSTWPPTCRGRWSWPISSAAA
jgi:hypothetical protein